MERPPRRWLRLLVILVARRDRHRRVPRRAGARASRRSRAAASTRARSRRCCKKSATSRRPSTTRTATTSTRWGSRDRRPVELSEVPKPLIQAVIATEDRTFYDNAGVDVQSMVRAFVENLDKGGVEQGGSTITQQLIKNRVFKNPKRDLDRKIKEAALAVRLNEEWSKNHILEEYLNTVYFGQGSYGVKAAAERFFDNTPLDKLDLAQAALLAGLIKNPEGDNPFAHPDRGDRPAPPRC